MVQSGLWRTDGGGAVVAVGGGQEAGGGAEEGGGLRGLANARHGPAGLDEAIGHRARRRANADRRQWRQQRHLRHGSSSSYM